MKRPTRRTDDGQAYLDLQNEARAEGRGTQELLTLYVVERWLARLSQSQYAGDFVVKGGMLLAAYQSRRPTADLDALARRIVNDGQTVIARFRDRPAPHDLGFGGLGFRGGRSVPGGRPRVASIGVEDQSGQPAHSPNQNQIPGGAMAIEVLSAVGRWDHFAALMARTGCLCMAYRNSSLDAVGRLEHMRNLCEREPGPGVLAFVDGEVAAWCSIAPKRTYRALVNSRTIPHVDDAEAWSAVCFRVRPGFRRRGLMHDLLDGAIEHARASGAIVIEGYPVDPEGERVDQSAAYVGTVDLFEAHGFERVQQTAGRSGGKRRWLVHRRLA